MEEKKMATTSPAAAQINDTTKLQNNFESVAINIEKSLSSITENDGDRIFDAIARDFERMEAAKDSIPEVVGMLRIKSANDTLTEAKQRPDPKPLWLSLWYEGEVCCLFADSNLGKSIYAVQIAESIARTQRVLYFDFELSDKQFQLRYTDEEGNAYRFSDNFLRAEVNKESLDVSNFEDNIISNIEEAALQSGARMLIIDNLTWICSNSEKGDVAGRFMMKLTALKQKHDFSVLVIAHTPKRSQANPITQNDLAGSKKLYNFFDSCFSIGISAKDAGLRYVKQMKVRHGEFEYGADNVIVYQIDRINSFLQFILVGYATEKEHLKEQSDNDMSQDEQLVKELIAKGLSVREVGRQLNMSRSKVQRLKTKK